MILKRHPVLSRLSLADRLFPALCHLPQGLRKAVSAVICRQLTARTVSAPHPERVTLFVTEHCNLRCQHCFVSRADAPSQVELTTAQWRQLFTRSAGRISQVLVTGGEPTLRPDLAEIMLSAANQGLVPTLSLFTNGLRPERLQAVVDAVLANSTAQLHFQVSIDGPAAFHDQNRGVTGSRDKACETLAMLSGMSRAHPGRVGRIVACTALSRRNLHLLPEIVAEVAETGALHSFTFVRSSEHGVFGRVDPELVSEFSPVAFDSYLDPQDMRQALDTLRELLWSRFPGSLFYATNRVILEGIASSLAKGAPVASPCHSGVGDIVILSDGSVARCEMLKPFGRLPDHDMDLEMLLAAEGSRRHYAKTSACWCVHDCAVGLSIMHERALLESLLAGPGCARKDQDFDAR